MGKEHGNKGKVRTEEQNAKAAASLAALRDGKREPPSEANRLRSLKQDIKKYGFTYESYLAFVAAHNNVCAICHNPEKAISAYGTPKRLTIDHCHTTNKVRGLLCENCNRGLGYLQDNTEILESALRYLAATA